MKKSTFLSGPILPALLRFSVPILLALLLQALYGAVDLWAVGRFCGEADVSAVATGSQAMQIVTGLVTGLSTGTTVLLGKQVGQRDHKGAADLIGSSIWIFGALGVVLSVVVPLCAPAIAEAMNAPGEAMGKTVAYIQICGAGSLFIVGYNLISAIFRGLGDSKSPLLFVLIACGANIAGDILLIKYFRLAAAGAAIATIGAQGVSVLLSLVLIRRRGLPFPFGRRNLRFSRGAGRGVVRLGAPIALQSMCNEISYLILIGLVNVLGVTASAGVGIAEKLVMFILLIPMAFMQSISSIVAQNIGAGQEERAKRVMWVGIGTAALLGGVMSYLSFFHGDTLSSIFIKEAAVIAASAEFLRATAIECFILSIAYCFTGYFNGVGRTAFVMVQGLCAIFLVRIPYAWLASRRPEPRLFQIGLSAAWAAVFTLAVCAGSYLRHARKKAGRPWEPEVKTAG